MTAHGESGFRANQVLNWIYQGVYNPEHMTNLPAATRRFLKEETVCSVPGLEKLSTSKDGTKKALFRLLDGQLIEAVLMKYEHGYSVCISTQVGCRMGCRFCASTRGGLIRNLTSGEMIGQILALSSLCGHRISNVVLMGSGEPLDNFEEVRRFLEHVSAPWGLGIGQRHITLSTCGVAPMIRAFADLDNQVTLAISLHQTTDAKRRELMPIAQRYDLQELFDSLNYYQQKTGRRISFEFALLRDVNDSLEEARALAILLRGLKSHVNLIPLNEIEQGVFRRPDPAKVRAFQKELDRLGIETTIRREMGSDIDAACGQLKRSYLDQGGTDHGGNDQ